ncbi:MAG: hypothetical protein M3448_00920 [Pseudomonadota bacterium]|nr:hypothetical protein [Pseudomonadota bacterium]
MKARWQIIVAASAASLAAGTPALAQEANPPAPSELIGSPQLRDFNLNGTVTREAQQPAQRQPEAQQTTNTTPQASTARPSQPVRESAAAASRPEPAPREERARESASVRLELPPPTPARRTPAPAVADEPPLTAAPAFDPAPAESRLDVSPDDVPIFPWLIAALALAATAAWFFLRQRPRESYAGGRGLAFEAPAPAPPPPVRTRPPAAAQPSSDIVSIRLRPWIEIEFNPQRAVVDAEKAAIQFELTVFNSGNAPARDVLVEACLFNAGPMQDQQIRTFFDNPVAQGQRVPVIGPKQRVVLNTAVLLPRDQVRPFEIEGRHLFVPLVAFNALYGWGRGEGQNSVSYLVGKDTGAAKLAPFRLDLGPRMFRNLAAREHELKLRK